MIRVSSAQRVVSVIMAMALVDGCGGSSDTTQPKPVASVVISSPASATIGAIGRTRQFTAQAKDAGGGVVSGAAIGWGSSDSSVATVSASGLVTAVHNGAAQITATSAGFTSPQVPVTVAQVTASIVVTSTSGTPDTLFATTRTRQFSASAKDSTGTVLLVQPTFAWVSTLASAATVDAASGLATAVADGTTQIQAGAAGITGARPLVIRRLAATHSLTPTVDSITTNGGTTGTFTGSASDSSGAALPLTWSSRNTGILTVSPASGATTVATGTGNGTTRVVLGVSAGPVDSASVTVSNQVVTAPATAAVTVGDNFFKSVHNNTQNPAIDTIAAGGTVTWTWTGVNGHSVLSTGSPSFTGSAVKTSGTFQVTFNSAGTYTYECSIHGALMPGTIVVR